MKVSQNAGALKLQFADATNVDDEGVVVADAIQVVVVPPLEPAQVHNHGPVPWTVVEVPVEHRLIVGVEEAVVPFADPQAPLTGEGGVTTVLFAEQVAVVPLLEPAQDQVKGPVPLTDEVEPVVQRLVVGAVETVVPFADPQAPLIGVEEVPIGAEHTAFTPPLVPAQLQLKAVLVFLMALALPVEQRLAVGAVEVFAPLALPQAPLILGSGPFTGADTPGRVL